MNKLDELIKELCPNGVEYKSLGEIATILRGGNFQKKDFRDAGVPCIHYGQIYTKYGLFVDETITFITEECAKKQKFAKTNDIVMAVTSENIEDVCKCLAWLGNDDVAVSGHSAIISHNQNPKYLVYYFHSQMFFAQKRKLAHGTKVIEVTPDTLKNIKLPVPPLEVQREIVRILDSFTLLTAELTAELTARKKQYEFYRNKLLTFDNNVKIVPLADIADIGTGSSNTNEGLEEGKYPFYVRSQEPLRKNEYEYDETAIITAGDGVGVERFENSESGEYFAVFMDMQMPVMDGIEATRQIRGSEREDSNIPIFAMTANTFAVDKKRCQDAGMDGYIPKPINLKEIQNTLNETIES